LSPADRDTEVPGGGVGRLSRMFAVSGEVGTRPPRPLAPDGTLRVTCRGRVVSGAASE